MVFSKTFQVENLKLPSDRESTGFNFISLSLLQLASAHAC